MLLESENLSVETREVLLDNKCQFLQGQKIERGIRKEGKSFE
jgi:hypothetical protein